MKRVSTWGFTLLVLCISLAGARAQVTKSDYQRVDTLSHVGSLVYGKAVRPTWIGSTSSFWYCNHERTGDWFYLVNAQTGAKKQAFDAVKLAKALAKAAGKPVVPGKLPFTTIRFADDLKSISFDAFDGSWTYTLSSNVLVRSSQPAAAKEEDPKRVTSPDKQWEAYTKDFNLYLFNCKDRKDYQLTFDGMVGLYYSAADIKWSPDSRKLATTKVKEVTERKIPLIASSPSTQKQPLLRYLDYAKPGDVITTSTPALFDVVNRTQVALNVAPFANQYNLFTTGWRKDSRAFTFEFNQRGHQAYQVAEVDAASGNIHLLVNEQASTFIHYDKNYRYDINDGREMLWSSERSGWRHIYLIDCATGIAKPVTQGQWVVRSVEHVDEANRTMLFAASGVNPNEDPYLVHYYRINLDGSAMVCLTPEAANHTATFSGSYQYLVDAYSRPDMPAVSVLRSAADGKVITELERSDIGDLQKEGWTMPEVFSAKGRDGKTDIWGTILRPSNFDSAKLYPVVEMIYAGPHDSHVPKSFSPYFHLSSRLCELGFVVVLIDGMGTANRSKAFHDVCWKNLKDAGFPDRIAWIKAAAARYPYMDTTRVGIYGWSAGGQNAMGALLFHNSFYKVAVAACGCHDNRMDKIWWNEQWMGYPVDQHYAECSNVDNAWRLKGKLLLMNGEVDENVDPASTLQVVSALVKAGKNFDQLYLPGYGHSLGGKFEMHKIHDFFVENLLRQTPPEW